MDFSDVKKVYLNGSSVKVIRDANGNILWKGTVLPPDYQQVEWIESNGGNQYIDTGLASGWQRMMFYKIEADMLIPNVNQPFYACQGVGNWGGNYGFYLLFPSNAHTDTLRFGAGQYDESFVQTPNDHQRHKYIIDIYNEEVWVDDTMQKFTRWVDTSTNYGNIFLFGLGKNGVKQVGLNARIYSMKIWFQSTIVRDLYPCYRQADNEIGLYDLSHDIFYPNLGSGTFTKGRDV